MHDKGTVNRMKKICVMGESIGELFDKKFSEQINKLTAKKIWLKQMGNDRYFSKRNGGAHL